MEGPKENYGLEEPEGNYGLERPERETIVERGQRGKLDISNLSAFHLRLCSFKEILKQRTTAVYLKREKPK